MGLKATLKLKPDIANKINNIAIQTVKTEGSAWVEDYYKRLLTIQQSPEGNPFPEKAESTKRTYKEKGWDTENFLIRTGTSTQLNIEPSTRGFKIQPEGADILKRHEKRAPWMIISEQTRIQFEKVIADILKTKLKRIP